MGFGVSKIISLTQTSDQFGVTFQNLIKKLTIVNMVSSLIAMAIRRCRRCIHQKLIFFNMFEINIFINASFDFTLIRLSILKQWCRTNIESSVFVKEVLSSPGLPILSTVKKQWHVIIFNVM